MYCRLDDYMRKPVSRALKKKMCAQPDHAQPGIVYLASNCCAYVT